MNKKTFKRGPLIAAGIGFILLSFTILGLSLWEAFGSANNRFMQMELPGFHDLDLKSTGVYAGIYQQVGTGPMPVADLSKMSVQVFSASTMQPVPVVMNTSGQTFSQFGLRGMPLFNFVIQEPGAYTLSGVYAEEKAGPPVQILLMSEATQDIKPTLLVGLIFFGLFLALGIWILVKSKTGVIRLL